MSTDILPRGRRTGIVDQSHGKEIFIYDLETHKAYNLNETLTAVFLSCDGKTSFDELKRRHSFSDDLITLALDQLKTNNLLESHYPAAALSGVTRREVIRRAGLASMVALPMITALSAPRAANASSLTNSICATPGGQVCAVQPDCDAYCQTTFNSSCTCTLNCCVECPNPNTTCNNACVNLAADPNNCGICGFACGPNANCVNGNCIGIL